MDQVLLDAAERIFQDGCDKAALDAAEAGAFPEHLWRLICANGFHLMALPDSGVDLKDVFGVLRLAGRWALPLPFAEVLLANRWLGDDGDGLKTIGRINRLAERPGTGVGAGCAAEVWRQAPWGRHAERVLGVGANQDLFVGMPEKVSHSLNLAGEPRDDVEVSEVQPLACAEPAYALLALSRVVLCAGTLERVLQLGLSYAQEREQFGRPIARFQAIQHLLAVAAGEVAAAERAALAAIEALHGERFEVEVAVAKARVGEAVGIVAESVHQVHGAMGFAYEHQLHHFTRRLWAWREEYGSEPYWQALLGRRICALGADRVWGFLATRS